MKAFLSEYGITIVVATVIMALIGTATFLKNTGGNSLKDITNNFLQEAQLAEAEAPAKPTPTITITNTTWNGEDFFENAKDLTVSTNSDGAISAEFASSAPLSINISGNKITIWNSASTAGSATLIVKTAETDEYSAGEITYTINYPKAGNAPTNPGGEIITK